MSKTAERHPQDWYIEQLWTVRALMAHVRFDRAYTVLDPTCGAGTVPTAFQRAGFKAFGMDMVDRWAQVQRLYPFAGPRPFNFLGEHDWLGDQRHMIESEPLLSVVFNPPYSCTADIADRCIRKALSVAHGKALCIPANPDAIFLPFQTAWIEDESRLKLMEKSRQIGISWSTAYAELHLNLDTQMGRDMHAALKFDLAKGQPVQEWSFGYDALDADFQIRPTGRVRVLKKLKLDEISTVVRGAGERTRTIAIKSAELKDGHFAGLIASLGDLALALPDDPASLSATGLKQLGEIHGAIGAVLAAKAGPEADAGAGASEQAAVEHAVGSYFAGIAGRHLKGKSQ